MRIAGFKTFVVANPPPHFGGRYFVFLKLVADDGSEGVGEKLWRHSLLTCAADELVR